MEEKVGTQRMNNSTLRYEQGREPTPRAEQSKNHNHHPTVKPVKLMEYLVRLVTPKNGICLDPFIGSGTTGVACANTGRKFIGIELEQKYVEIANKRLQEALSQTKLMEGLK
jgi:site-specific DNA-methyltransferase (adenine-specific)